MKTPNDRCTHSPAPGLAVPLRRGRRRVLQGLACWLIPMALNAQTADGAVTPEGFPVDAQALTAQVLKERLEGHAFIAKLKNGTTWRMQFKGKYFYIDVSTGVSDWGTWRTEDGKLCVEMQRSPNVCSEMRGSDKNLFLKRVSTGEVVRYENND